jgi:hypothetical protein
VPFLIAAGYSGGALPERFRDKHRIEKPFDAVQVAAALPALMEKA